ncbi:MAG: hypothetical protein Q9222_003376 [Ikaeria aurantiellina]
MDIKPSLTGHLLSIHPNDYSLDTSPSFLAKAGNGTLRDSDLCKWLVQDKYFRFGCVRFIGRLLGRLHVPVYEKQDDTEYLRRLTLNLLVDTLIAVRQEIDFQEQTARKYNLILEYAPPNETTTEYMRLFEEVSAERAPMVLGLLALWATGHCSLRAWTYTASHTPNMTKRSQGKDLGGIAALDNAFIPNWTSRPFSVSVTNLGLLTDQWIREDGPGDCAWEDFSDLWERVLELEADSWPAV